MMQPLLSPYFLPSPFTSRNSPRTVGMTDHRRPARSGLPVRTAAAMAKGTKARPGEIPSSWAYYSEIAGRAAPGPRPMGACSVPLNYFALASRIFFSASIPF